MNWQSRTTLSVLPHQRCKPTLHHALLCGALLLCGAGFAINAAVAFERQLAQMFFPLLSLATIVRFDPYYPRFNASFDNVAKELMEQVGWPCVESY